MGTRHLTAVVIDGEYKVAQYGQWDGYPRGQGTTVLDFLKACDAFEFATAIRNCTVATDAEIAEAWAAVGSTDGWASLAQGKALQEKHPHFSRHTGAKVLQHIVDNDGLPMCLNVDFAADSLFCEWAYVIDLDTLLFEVYEGYNKKKAVGRFSHIKKNADGYYPVTLVASFPLATLPSEADFVAMFEEEEETA